MDLEGHSSPQSWPTSLKTKNCYDDNFVITGSTCGGCCYDNLQCHKWFQSWHHDDSWFSVTNKISIDQSHRYGRPQAACREPAGSYDKTTAICFVHKTQYLLIRAPYTCIVVFWHISNIIINKNYCETGLLIKPLSTNLLWRNTKSISICIFQHFHCKVCWNSYIRRIRNWWLSARG